MICTGLHTMEVEATGYVRYVRAIDGQERILGPYCDEHQADICVVTRARTDEVREVGAVPLDYRERLTEAERRGRIVRIRREIERHPGTRMDRASDLARAILDLDESGEIKVDAVIHELRRLEDGS